MNLLNKILRLSTITFAIFVTILANAQVKFPLSTSSNQRYLIDADAKPFPILGRTAWCLISQPEDEYKKFITNSLEHGHNAIEIAAIFHWPTGNRAPYNDRREAPFLKQLDGQPWDGHLVYKDSTKETPDLLTPNEPYWTFLDSLLTYCEIKGIVVFMFPGYVGYNGEEQGWLEELVTNGPEKVKAYGAWFANRYKKHGNIVWMLLGDMGSLNKAQAAAEQALIDGLKSVSGQASTHYTAEAHSCENAADDVQFGKEMNMNGVYTWTLDCNVPYLGRKGYADKRTMPAFLLEEPYDEEGPDGNGYNPNSTQPVRRFQWWGMLTTIGGYISGNGYVWPFIDPIWQQHLNTQAALDMQRLNEFVKLINWWELEPSGLGETKTLITDSNNIDTSASFVAATASKNGKLLVAYIPPAHKGIIHLDTRGMVKKFYGYWFDPTTGEYFEIKKSRLKSGSSIQQKVPGKNKRGDGDWVLLLTDQKR